MVVSIFSYWKLEDDKNEILLRYRLRAGAVKFATNAFFFQEGQAKVFQAARYGKFSADENGELLLSSMHDKDMIKLEEKITPTNNTKSNKQ